MLSQIALIVTTVKIFFIPLYRSTDFEVHRNWLAVTHNLSVSEWYYDTTSEWTLDYPPLFAWLEYALSHVAKLFDPKMLHVDNLNYDSDMTVLFQRLSVIVLDFVFICSAKRTWFGGASAPWFPSLNLPLLSIVYSKMIKDPIDIEIVHYTPRAGNCSNLIGNGKLLVFILLVSNPGLLMVDHIHFQYNGFLYGILMYSISNMIRLNYIQAALWFAVLLNLKHIYIYVAPAYVIHLLRSYCFTVPSPDGVRTAWYSFSVTNLFKLGAVVVTIFGLSFGPFIQHLPQVFSRLFPFKRGLCHAYWAPNFWAIYNFSDKFLQHALPKVGIDVSKTEAAMTGGLVQEYDHAVLPSISPSVTFVLTAVSMLPALVKLWYLGADRRYRNLSFVRCLVICASCSFIFSWHVHEKAILMILIPLSFLAVLGDVDGKLFLILSTVGHYSLFPLLFPKNLLPIKLFMLLTHCAIAFGNIPTLYEVPKHKSKRRGFLRLPMLGQIESLYVYGLLVLCIYENALHTAWGLDKKLPFLPLMLTSVYCAIGVIYFWIRYYYYFLTFNLSKVPKPSTTEVKKVN